VSNDRRAGTARAPRRRARLDDERGIAGFEIIPAGILTFVVFVLVIANAWGVVDAKAAAAAAAREGARAWVEAPDAESAQAAAVASARAALAGYGRDPDRAVIAVRSAGGFGRCARVVVEVSYDVPTVQLPWVGGFAGSAVTARSTHSEVVDPFRSGLSGEADCAI
jgi:hypothetical protein